MKSIPLTSMSPACRAAAEKALAGRPMPKESADPNCWYCGFKRAQHKKNGVCYCVAADGRHHSFASKKEVTDGVAKKKPAIRIPKPPEPTKAEREYWAILAGGAFHEPVYQIRYEAVTFRLKSGCLYTPDLTVWNMATLLLCIEIKGRVARNHSASRSVLAFKTAASEWPAIRFRYAAKQKDGTWNITEIN